MSVVTIIYTYGIENKKHLHYRSGRFVLLRMAFVNDNQKHQSMNLFLTPSILTSNTNSLQLAQSIESAHLFLEVNSFVLMI